MSDTPRETCIRLDPAMLVRTLDPGGFARVNRAFSDDLGYAAEELIDQPFLDWIHPDDRAGFQCVLEAGRGGLQARHRTVQGDWILFQWEVRSDDGPASVLGRACLKSAVSETEQAAESPPSGDVLVETLHAMARIVEDEFPGMRCSIILVDDEGRFKVGAGPSLPADYNSAVEKLRIGPTVGSCGTASYWNVPVIVEDIQNDFLWKDLREAAASAGVAACWSHPITSMSGEVLGATAVYDSVPRTPTERELRGLKTVARMVGLAVERGRAELALRESEAKAKRQSKLLSAVTEVVTSFVESRDWTSTSEHLVQAALELTGSQFGCIRVVGESGDLEQVEESTLIRRPECEERPHFDPVESAAIFCDINARLREVVQQAAPVLVDDLRRSDDDSNRGDEVSRIGMPALSLLATPLTIGGEVVAVLGLANSESGYTEEDLETALVLCGAGSGLFDSHKRLLHEASLEDQLRQAGKMEALGVLAGGVAHDFNNMLSIILGNAQLAMKRLADEATARRMLNTIVTTSQRAAELCMQMLAYAGRGSLAMERIECNSSIRELRELLKVSLSKKTELELLLSDEPLFVEADKTQLRQVFMNLIVNASEAIGSDEGRIVVKTDARYYSDSELARFRPVVPLSAGEFVRVTFIDDGSGMDAETQSKIFDPFFTTKFTGRGLGLASAQGVLFAHKGVIGLESQVGEGTTFTVLIPRAPSVSNDAGRFGDADSAHLGKTVLVVDDEPSLRLIVQETLVDAGFDVLLAADGQEAVEVFERSQSVIDCVLLDLSMPRLGGEEALRKLQEIRSDVRVILTSGFTEEEFIERFQTAGFAGFVQKPALADTLIAKIQKALSVS